MGACRTLGKFPLVAEQMSEEIVTPVGWRGGPSDFQTAGNRVPRNTRAVLAAPAQSLRLKIGRPWIGANLGCIPGSVGLAEAAPAGDQGDSLLIIHGHARKSLANIARGRDWV